MSQQIVSIDELDIVLVEDDWSCEKTLEVQTVCKILEQRWKLSNGMEALGSAKFRFRSRHSVVNAKCQCGHLLCDDHQWRSYVNGGRAVVVVKTVKVDTHQITHCDHKHHSKHKMKCI